MPNDDFPPERKNTFYRRDLSKLTTDQSAENSQPSLQNNVEQNPLVKFLPGIIAVTAIIGLIYLLKSCMMPEKHTPIYFTYTTYTANELQTALLQAKTLQKPVMMEFYATWCGYCRMLDAKVLSLASIQQYLRKMVTIRMDVSDQTGEQQDLMEQYKAPGTPTLVFFNKEGNLDTVIYNSERVEDDLHAELKKLTY